MIEHTRQKTAISFWSPIRLAYGLLPLMTILRRYDIAAEPLLDKTGIARFGMMDPSYTISIEQEIAFHSAAMKQLDRPEVSLEIAREYRLRGFSVLGLAMQASHSPLHMLQLLIRYPRLAWGVFDGYMEIDATTLHVSFSPQPRLGALENFLAERDLACAIVLFEEATGARFPINSISFRHPCSGNPERYEDFFGCPVQFNAPEVALNSDLAVASQSLPHADASICAFYTAQCERMSKSMDQPFSYSEAVRSRLQSSLSMLSLEQLADKLYMTPRTLQRRLSDEDSSFSQLLREVRQQRAKQLLAETRQGVEEIALTLGFNDAAAFSHAFKTWYGESPLGWRRTHTH